jgi:O-antigen ligase
MSVTLTPPRFTVLFFSERFHFRFALACVVGMFAGLVASRGVLSISMIAMVVNGLIYWFGAAQRGEKVWEPVFGAVGLFFLVYLLSGLYSADKQYWLERLQVKIPFLLLPIGFLPLKKLDRDILDRVLSAFVIGMFLSAIYVLVNYILNRNEITYWSGEVMQTPYSHVRYSLMIAFASFVSLHLFLEDFEWFSKFDKWLIAALGLLLAVFLHVLAVRSGLVAFYLAVVFLIVRYAWVNSQWLAGVSFAIGLMLLPILAYLYVPTFRDKVGYMRYTVNEFLNGGEMRLLSDGQRLTSIQKGFEVFKAHPIIGVGVGDLPAATQEVYHNDGTEQALRMPHNQWVWCLASIGLVGTLIVAFSLFFPIFYLRDDFNTLTVSFFVIVQTSLLTEATLEEQIGSAFYLVFLLLFLMAYRRTP